MIATIVDTKALWETVVASFAAGVGTTIVASIGILGAAKFAEANRAGRGTHAMLFGMLAVLAAIATAAAVVVAVIVMANK
jgi:hypothetical protein